MLPKRRSTYPARLTTVLAWMIAVLLVALVARELTDRWVTRPVPLSAHERSADPRAAAREIAARLSSGPEQATLTPAPEPLTSTVDYILMGVATGFGGSPGFALLRTPSGEILSAVQGGRLPSGETVIAIGLDHLRLNQGGRESTLRMSSEAIMGTLPAPRSPRPTR